MGLAASDQGAEMLLYHLFKVTLGPLFWLVKRPKVTGRENLPTHGGAVIAANHIHWFNGALLVVAIPRPVVFGARADFFRVKAMNCFVRCLLRAFGQLPIERNNLRKAVAFVEKAARLAKSGQLVGIFPEGGISPDGRLYDAYTGVARIATAAEVPIVPVGLLYPRWRWCRVRVVIGAPIDASHLEIKEVGERVTAALQGLTGQQRAHCLLRRGSSAP